MAMTKEQLLKWVEGMHDHEEVGIDEGGLCLRVVGGDYYLELGGIDDWRSGFLLPASAPEDYDGYSAEVIEVSK